MMDFLLDDNDDMIIANGDFQTGDSFDQEVGIIIRLNQGEMKSDPVLGPNLVRMINAKANHERIKSVMKLNLARDAKDYDKVKDYITYK